MEDLMITACNFNVIDYMGLTHSITIEEPIGKDTDELAMILDAFKRFLNVMGYNTINEVIANGDVISTSSKEY